MVLAVYLLFSSTCFFTTHEHLLTAYIYPHKASSDTPIKEYRLLFVLSIKIVTSRRFQKWCSSGVVSAFVLRETTDFTGFFGTFQDTTGAFAKLLESHGLRKIRFHDLRHSCASLLLKQGVPMKQIQEWLGHSDISTTANIYAHLDSQSKQLSAETMERTLALPGK